MSDKHAFEERALNLSSSLKFLDSLKGPELITSEGSAAKRDDAQMWWKKETILSRHSEAK